MGIDEAAVQRAVDRWQPVLRLQDWDITPHVVRQPWRKNGNVKIDESNKLAALLLHESVSPSFLDEVVVHELIHVKLWPLDQMIEDLLTAVYGDEEDDPKRRLVYDTFMGHLEVTTQDLTRALLSESGIAFQRVSKTLRTAIEEEIPEP